MWSRERRTAGPLASVASGALVLGAFLFVAFWSPRAAAYPWMIKHGYSQCASCHTDPMGGETLTGFGRVMSDTTLSMRYGADKDPTGAAGYLFGVPEPRALRLGGSLRTMALYKAPKGGAEGDFAAFPMQMDVYGQLRVGPVRGGGSLGISRVEVGSPHAQAAQITSNTDGERPLNAVSRNHWLGVDIGEHALVRAGRINLPFGVRIPEHVMWVREATRTDRESDQQHGVAVAYYEGKIRGEVMGVLGNYQLGPDKYRERGYALSAEYLLGDRMAVGLSSLLTHAKEDRLLANGQDNTRQAHGLNARIAPLREFSLLGEADVLLSSRASAGYVGMVQADYEFLQGMHGLLTGEIVDLGKMDAAGGASGPGAGEPLFGAWISFGWFFFTHFDLRMDLVLRKESPVTFQSQLHFYM